MKIALCLYGNVGHKQHAGVRIQQTSHDSYKEAFKPRDAWANPKRAFYGYKKYLFDKYDTDIFMHSWSVDFKKELLDLYKPKDHEIVKQKKFDVDLKEYGITNNTDISKWKISGSARKGYELLLPTRGSVAKIVEQMHGLAFRTKSRWWSNRQCIGQCGYDYDFVVVSRFDNRFMRSIPFHQMDPTKFYAGRRSGRPDVNFAFYDYWFITGPENMKRFGTLYDHIHDYCIRPTFACREHVVATIGADAIEYLFEHDTDYSLGR